jgi:hypothetical protein
MTHLRHLTRGTAAKALGLLVLGLVLAAVVSACGSSSASTGTTTSAGSTTGTTGTTGSASLSAFRACLQQHGFTRPQGGPGAGAAGGGGRPNLSAAQQKAFSACASLRPAGGLGGAGRRGGGAAGAGSAGFAAFQACLKQHGVQSGAAQTSSAKTQSAIAACRTQLPNGGNGPTTTTGG